MSTKRLESCPPDVLLRVVELTSTEDRKLLRQVSRSLRAAVDSSVKCIRPKALGASFSTFARAECLNLTRCHTSFWHEEQAALAAALASLPYIRELQGLDLELTSRPPEWLQHLGSMTKLGLEGSFQEEDNAAAEGIVAHCHNLQWLEIEGGTWSLPAFQRTIANVAFTLKSLRFEDVYFEEDRGPHIVQLLRTGSARSTPTSSPSRLPAAAKVMEAMHRNLERLELISTVRVDCVDVDDSDSVLPISVLYEGLAALSSLLALDISRTTCECRDCPLDEGLWQLSGLSRLTSLKMNDMLLRRRGLHELGGVTALRELLLERTWTNSGHTLMQKPLSLPSLTDLTIPYASGWALGELVSLTRLEALGCGVLESAETLGSLSLLRQLVLRSDCGVGWRTRLHINILEARLAHLTGLTNLERLALEWPAQEVTKRGMEFLASLPALQHLDIGGKPICQMDALQPLAKVAVLRHLGIPAIQLLSLSCLAPLQGLGHVRVWVGYQHHDQLPPEGFVWRPAVPDDSWLMHEWDNKWATKCLAPAASVA